MITILKETKINSYKDKCDECGIFNYLKGINGKCLCSNCQNKLNKNQNIKKIQKKNKNELNILDFAIKVSHFSQSINDIMYL